MSPNASIRHSLDAIHKLLPTPTVSDVKGGAPGHDATLGDHVRQSKLLPTPVVTDAKGARNATDRPDTRLGNPGTTLTDVCWLDTFGEYADAIEHQLAVVQYSVPPPVEVGPRGNPRLNPRFSEWLMGLAPGHVTDHVPQRTHSLRIIGNGVVPQQAELALRLLAEEGP